MNPKLHILSNSRFHSYVSVSQLEMAKVGWDGMGHHVIHELARQMAEHIVEKRITSQEALLENARIYRMDVYVLSPEELSALVEERARQMVRYNPTGPFCTDLIGEKEKQ